MASQLGGGGGVTNIFFEGGGGGKNEEKKFPFGSNRLTQSLHRKHLFFCGWAGIPT